MRPGRAARRRSAQSSAQVAPFLEGRALVDPDALRVQFFEATGDDSSSLKVYCCVEIALFDLLGKALGVPVSELLGGRVRDRIRLYGSAGMYMPPEAYAAEAAAVAALGFRAYKMRPALGPEKDLETVAPHARGGRPRLRPDGGRAHLVAHGRPQLQPRHGRTAGRRHGRVRHRAGSRSRCRPTTTPPICAQGKDIVPLASGEHEPNEERYLDLILTQAVDYVQMDVCCQGGYCAGRRLFAEIARQGLSFAFHSWGTALEVMAAAHLGICWPEMVVEWLEYPCYSSPGRAGMYPFPLAAEILKDPLELDHGDLIVPRAPGLGVTVDERVIERYPWIPGPWSLFPHRFARPDPRRHVRSQRPVGPSLATMRACRKP